MFSTATFALAMSLSADAFAVSLAKGALFPNLPIRRSLVIAASFALLEAVAPLVGWAIGNALGPWLAAVDHWVAFGLLGFLGLRMVMQSGVMQGGVMQGGKGVGDGQLLSPPGWIALGVTALGTSVDGLAVGVTFALVMDRILPLLVAIAVVTFLMVWLGLRLGHAAGSRFGRIVQTLGGIGLMGIGTKILFEHLMA